MTVVVGARSLVKADAGVVHALLQARYYDGSKGEFLSEDPSFLAVGDRSQLQRVTGQDQTLFLSDPQLINSYGYARGNPISRSDPAGNSSQDAFFFALSYSGGNSGVAAAKQQAVAQLQAGARGYYAAAQGVVAVGGALVPVGLFGVSALPFVAGGLANVGARAYNDQSDGTQSSVGQYGMSYVLGGVTGQLTEGAPLGYTLKMTAALSIGESIAVDRQFSPTQTFASLSGAFISKVSGPSAALSRGVTGPQLSAALSTIKQAAVGLLAQIATLQATQAKRVQ
jgi:RHS repeat-associated protein